MISIIIPTYNRNQLLVDHLTHLHRELEGLTYEVIVINDFKQGNVELPEALSEYRIVNNPKSGVASARNLGASLATYDWLLFVDDDMKMNRHNVETYLTHFDKDKTAFTVNLDWKYSDATDQQLTTTSFGRFLLSISYNNLAGWNNLKAWPVIGVIDHNGLASCNLLISKALFQQSEGYNEQFSHAGAEDFEFSQRISQMGVKTQIDTRSQMIHNELDRLTKTAWFRRKYQAGITNRIAYDLGYNEVLIPNQWKFRSPRITNGICKSILFVTEPFRFLDPMSFLCYRALLGQALHAGFHDKKYRF